MTWGNPSALALLWLVPLLGALLFFLLRRRLRAFQDLASSDALTALAPRWRRERLRTRLVIWLLGAGLALLTVARPQWGYRWIETKQRGVDVMVVLDTSRSMLAEDVKPNRLQQAKWGIRDLVDVLQGDRVGLVAFAGGSFLQCPLTSDYAAFLLTLDDVYPGIIPRGGTAIAQALETAAGTFSKGSEADRVILLITDGEDHEGRLDDVAAKLKEQGVRVYAVGIGSDDGELIPVQDESGRPAFLKDREGRVVKSSLQKNQLQQLANATGGIFVRSTAGDSGMDRLVRDYLSQLKKGEGESKMLKVGEDRYEGFLAVALLLFAAEACLRPERRRAR